MGSCAHKSPKWGSRAWKILTPSFSYIMHPYQSNYVKTSILARKSHGITSRPKLVAPAIHCIRLKLYMNVLCCRHLQVADPSKNAHDNLKHIVCFVLQIQISATSGGERPQETNTIVHIRKYIGEYTLGNPGVL